MDPESLLPVKVALDTNHRFILRGGVTRYIEHLLQAFGELDRSDFTWFELNWPVENFGFRQPKRALKTLYREFYWGRCVAPRKLRASRADLLHSLDFPIIAPIRCPHVVTLHDLGYLRTPERFRPWTRLRARSRLASCITADKVISISRFTANEAMELLELPARKIEVVHFGPGFADPSHCVAAQPPEHPLPDEFLLAVGHLDPNKNLKLLRGIYELAGSQGRVLPPLVLVGARWEGVAHEGPPPKDWIFLGRQPDSVLRWLYEHALAKVFPSRYEGFGMTVLEAMSFGCPVICSPVASISEVAGDAALFAEQTPESFLHAILSFLVSGEREAIRERGRQRAADFSWEKCASETLQVYESMTG